MAFDPFTIGSALTGGAGLIGSILQNEANAKQASKAYNRSMNAANTSHVREVRDLRAAGLNPILSATGGSGASSPQAQPAHMENVMAPAISSALQARTVKREIENTDSQIQLNNTLGATQAKIQAREEATAKQIEQQTKILKAQAPALVNRAKVEAREAQMDDETLTPRYINRMINEGLGTVNNAKDAVNILKPKTFPKIKIPKGYDLYHRKTGELLTP